MPTLEELQNPPRVEVLPWEYFQEMFLSAYRVGEHCAIVGPNGSGKTLLGLELCKMIGARKQKGNGRPWPVTVLQYKPRDDTIALAIPDWPVINKWPPKYGEEHCIVWPRGFAPSEAARRQRAVFAPLLDKMYQEGGQCVFIPEAAYFERAAPAGLGLSGTMDQFWSTARSLNLSVVSDTQRPRKVTLLMWTEPAWLFVYRLKSRDDVKHIADLSGEQVGVWNVVPKLEEHEFLCIRNQQHSGEQHALYVSRVTVVTRNNRNGAGK